MGLQTSPPSSSRKRKRDDTSTREAPTKAVVDLTGDDDDAISSSRKKAAKKSPGKKNVEERRLKRFRPHPTAMYHEKLSRAKSQRMFVIDRSRAGTDEAPEEIVEMAGTTGNIYTVKIGLLPSCTCPDHLKGNQCKHIIYVMHLVLKAPEHLQYQLALLSSEVREILDGAPRPTSSASPDETTASNRKAIEGDCPICFTEFDLTEDVVYCKAACGNNIHRECFEQWAKSKSGQDVRCVYCRTPWQGDEESLKRVCKNRGRINAEGYTNVASELGISGGRDYSTYHQPWLIGPHESQYLRNGLPEAFVPGSGNFIDNFIRHNRSAQPEQPIRVALSFIRQPGVSADE